MAEDCKPVTEKLTDLDGREAEYSVIEKNGLEIDSCTGLPGAASAPPTGGPSTVEVLTDESGQQVVSSVATADQLAALGNTLPAEPWFNSEDVGSILDFDWRWYPRNRILTSDIAALGTSSDMALVIETTVPVAGLNKSARNRARAEALYKGWNIILRSQGLLPDNEDIRTLIGQNILRVIDDDIDCIKGIVIVYLQVTNAFGNSQSAGAVSPEALSGVIGLPTPPGVEVNPITGRPYPPAGLPASEFEAISSDLVDSVIVLNYSDYFISNGAERLAAKLNEYDRILQFSQYDGVAFGVTFGQDAATIIQADTIIRQFIEQQPQFEPNSASNILIGLAPNGRIVYTAQYIGARYILFSYDRQVETRLTVRQRIQAEGQTIGPDEIAFINSQDLPLPNGVPTQAGAWMPTAEVGLPKAQQASSPAEEGEPIIPNIEPGTTVDLGNGRTVEFGDPVEVFTLGGDEIEQEGLLEVSLSNRTKNYLLNWDIIVMINPAELPWTEFAQQFVIDPEPQIIASEKLPSEIPRVGGERTIAAAKNFVAPALNESFTCLRSTVNDGILNPGRDVIDRFKSIKTYPDVVDQTFSARAEQLEKELIAQADVARDSIADGAIQDVLGSIESVKDLKDIYKRVLNKASLLDLADTIAAGCIPNLNLSCNPIRLPPVPTFGFPDVLPTVDFTADLSQELLKEIVATLTEALLQTIVQTLRQLTDLCRDTESDNCAPVDGEEPDVNAAINAVVSEATASDPRIFTGDDIKKNIIKNITDRTQSDEASLASILEELNNLIEELSSILTTSEICRLFSGNPSQSTLDTVRFLIKNKYPLLYDIMPTNGKISTFFSEFGNSFGNRLCEIISNVQPEVVTLEFDKCGIPQDIEEEFERLTTILKEEQSVSPEELQRLLNNAKNRRDMRNKRLEAVSKLINLNSGDSNARPFDDIAKNFFQKNNSENGQENCSASQSIIQARLSHPTFDRMQNIVLDTMFTPIKIAFDEDIESLTEAMVTQITEKVPVPTEITTDTGDTQKSPELLALATQGIDIEKIAEEEEFVIVEKTRLKASPHVKRVLEGLEDENTNFSSSIRQKDISYSLNLPIDSTLESYLSNIGSGDNVLDLQGLEQAFVDAGVEIGDFSLDSLPNWKIEYNMPYVSESANLSSDARDQFMLQVYPGDRIEEAPEEEVLMVKYDNELDPELKSFINQTIKKTTPLSITLNQDGASETFIAPYPQALFGRYVGSLWNEASIRAMGSPNIEQKDKAQLDIFSNGISKFFSSAVHPQIVRDLFGLLGRQVASSTMFDSILESYGSGQTSDTSETPYLTQIAFTRQPDELEKECNFNPHPLKLDCFKREIVNQLASGQCNLKPEDLINPQNGPSEWEKQVLYSLVKLTIRAYVYDYVVRAIFLLPIFTIEESIDDYLIEFCIKKMTSELALYDNNYLNRFSFWAYKAYIIDSPVFVEDDVQSVQDLDDEKINDALNFFFEKSFEKVCSEVREMIERTVPGTVSTNKTPTKYLVNDWLPVIDLPEQPRPPKASSKTNGSLRFSTLAGGLVSKDKYSGITSIGGKPINLENGNLLLEKYYKVVIRNRGDIVTRLSSIRGVTQERAEKTADIVYEAWQKYFTENVEDRYRYVNIKNFSQAYTKFAEYIEDKAETRTDFNEYWKMENIFAEVRPGMRMIYLLPVKTGFLPVSSGDLENKFGTDIPSYDKYFGGDSYLNEALNSISDGASNDQQNFVAEALAKLRRRESAYSILENLSPPPDPTSLNQESSPGGSREIYPIPIIDTSTCVADNEWWLSNNEKNIFDISSSTPAPENKFWSTQYNIQLQSLKDDITSSTQYKFLFRYIFPIDRYMSIINVYTFMATSSQPNVETALATTKDELWRMMTLLVEDGIGPFGYENSPSNEDQGLVLEKFEKTFEKPCFSFAFSAVPPNLKGFGLDIVKKIVLKVPLLIFKSFVEQADPNIRLAKFIEEIYKALGVCIPLPVISFALLPPTVFGFPPFGIGIGPPLTPFGFGYLGTGLGGQSIPLDLDELIDYIKSRKAGSDDSELPDSCRELCGRKVY
jgi:hypothetical protein